MFSGSFNHKLRRGIILLPLVLLITLNIKAQLLEPVKWSYTSELTGENTAMLKFTATIDDGWYLYSQNIPDGGPIKTSFYFNDLSGFEFVDDDVIIEQEPGFDGEGSFIYRVVFDESPSEEKDDPEFNMLLNVLSHTAEFWREIRITTADPLEITGFLEFMCCDDSRCLPPSDREFAFNFQVDNPAKASQAATTDDQTEAIEFSSSPDDSDRGAWGMFIFGFLGGLLALLTPCVFPMIPMTVSFFLRGSDNKAKGKRDALFYGISIIIIYVMLGMGISLIFGSDQLNMMATSPVFNIIFFVILIVFAAAFFGLFELQLPSSWINAMDSKAEKTGGLLGVFLMAFVLVLVSFSCTGPIIGTLLVQAAVTGSWLSPAIGMLGFSTALAIPFTLLAVFPSMLGSMPKSGGWLNSVKVVLAFIMVAFALKFLSTADSVAQWGLLTRELFLSIWIVNFALMGFYLLGKIKFHHDSDVPYISVPRLMLVIITFAFTVYLIPGMWGAPLKAVSSFLPPTTSQEFNLHGASFGAQTVDFSEDIAKYDTQEGVYGLIKFLDYEEGMEFARKEGRPVFLDFTGLGCSNCRKMESSVWSDNRVLDHLRNDFVIISLYTDKRNPLPPDQQYVSDFGGRQRNIRTVGAKWSDFQARNYGVNSQPYYVLLDHNEKRLAEPYGYNANVDLFLEFLNTGLSNFEKRK
jgi:thiol:disulfide interchange protein